VEVKCKLYAQQCGRDSTQTVWVRRKAKAMRGSWRLVAVAGQTFDLCWWPRNLSFSSFVRII